MAVLYSPADIPFMVAANDAPLAWKEVAAYQCDGTNDQIEINNAIAALPTNGGSILLSPGTFNVSSSIVIEKDNISVFGQGTGQRTGATQTGVGTKIQAVAGLTTAVILVHRSDSLRVVYGVHLENFTIDGAYIGTDTNGVTFRSNRGFIQRVHIHRCTGYGVFVRGYTAAETGDVRWETYDTQLAFVQIGDCYNTGARETATAGGGFYAGLEASDLHIVGCVFFNNYDNVRIGAGSQQFTNTHTYDAVRYNIWFDNAGSRTKLVNLKIEGAGNHGVLIDGTTLGTSDIQIVGCNLKNNGDAVTNTADHIHILGPADHSRVLIVGNSFSKDTATANLTRYAINMPTNDARYALIVGNSFGSDTHYGTGRVNDGTSGAGKAIIQHNYGTNYLDANGGTISIANGGTITHGLWRTPTRYAVTPTVAGHIVAVTAASSTTLTVSLLNHDGTTISTPENVVWWAEA